MHKQLSTMETAKVRENDVFRFRYSDQVERGIREHSYDAYHCFDGILKAHERMDGMIILWDTYWGTVSNSSRWFTVEEAHEKGELTFVCNLDDVDPIRESDMKYYDDSDVFALRIHHGYRNEYYLRRGAERSQTKMLETINSQIESTEQDIRHGQDKLIRLKEMREKVTDGDTSVWLLHT